MSTWLLIIAGYLAFDALITVGWVGKRLTITPANATVTVVVRAVFCTVLVVAALGGVTP